MDPSRRSGQATRLASGGKQRRLLRSGKKNPQIVFSDFKILGILTVLVMSSQLLPKNIFSNWMAGNQSGNYSGARSESWVSFECWFLENDFGQNDTTQKLWHTHTQFFFLPDGLALRLGRNVDSFLCVCRDCRGSIVFKWKSQLSKETFSV